VNRLPKQVEWIAAQVKGRPGFRLMVILAAPGCAYARTSGGCTNCGFPQAFGTGHPVSAEDYLAQVEAALARIPPGTAAPVEVDLYNSGSYFNPEEVPEAAQPAMLALAAARSEVTSLLVETRPEYLTAARLGRAVAACQGKPLEVGIGLESANPEILSRRIHKGYTWEDFASAASLIAQARVGLLAYILLKPINTGEREAIEDSVETARKVFTLGRDLGVATRVALEPCFVAPQTPLYHAFEQGRYRPPWLWSVVEAVLRMAPLGRVLVGLSDEGMNPRQAPRNCDECTSRFRDALAAFNLTQDAAGLRALSCDCRRLWLAEGLGDLA
jgi:radical SAM enzyme (TIGR01210 family)